MVPARDRIVHYSTVPHCHTARWSPPSAASAPQRTHRPPLNGHALFTEVDLAQRLAALVPPARKNGVSDHGVLAGCSGTEEKDYTFDRTTGGTVADPILVYWVDIEATGGTTHLGGYAAPDSLYGVNSGLPDTLLTGDPLESTTSFNDHLC